MLRIKDVIERVPTRLLIVEYWGLGRNGTENRVAKKVFGIFDHSMVAAFFAQIAVIYVPAFQWVFRTEALTIADWVRIAFMAFRSVYTKH